MKRLGNVLVLIIALVLLSSYQTKNKSGNMYLKIYPLEPAMVQTTTPDVWPSANMRDLPADYVDRLRQALQLNADKIDGLKANDQFVL